MKKRKKAGFIKTSLAALAIALSEENCTKFNPISPQIPQQRIEESKRKLTSNASENIKAKVESRVDSFAAKPIGATENGYYWVKDRNEVTPDFDGNRKIDLDDFFLFADNFNSSNEKYDLIKNGKVDFDDFFFFANEFGKETNSDLSATKLATRKIPQVESFIELRKIDLSQYVKDLVFNDPIDYSVVSAKGLIAKLAKNEKGELSVIEYRPRGIYNFTDDGLAELVFKADKKGATAEEKIEVEVARDDTMMEHYQRRAKDGNIWSKPFETVSIYVGPARTSDDGFKNKWTGPKPTQQQIDWAKKALSQTLPTLTGDYFNRNINFILTEDQNSVYRMVEEQKEVLVFWDNSLPGGGGATNFYPANGIYKKGGILRFTTSNFLSDESTYSHEIANLAGLADANDDETWSIGSRRSTKPEPDPRDIFVGTAYYDH